MHHLGLRAQATRRAADALLGARAAAEVYPRRVVAMALGEWNVQATREGDLSQDAPTAPHRLPISERAGQRRIGGILQECVKLHQPLACSRASTGRMPLCLATPCSRCGRGWRSRARRPSGMRRGGGQRPLARALGTARALAHIHASAARSVVECVVRGVGATIPFRGRPGAAVERWRGGKASICAVVEAAHRLSAEADDTDVLTTDGASGRAVMCADAWLARRLLQHTMVARRELGVNLGRVFLRDGVGFGAGFAAAHAAALETSDRELHGDPADACALRAARARRLLLVRVVCESDVGDAAGGGQERPPPAAVHVPSAAALWETADVRSCQEVVGSEADATVATASRCMTGGRGPVRLFTPPRCTGQPGMRSGGLRELVVCGRARPLRLRSGLAALVTERPRGSRGNGAEARSRGDEAIGRL